METTCSETRLFRNRKLRPHAHLRERAEQIAAIKQLHSAQQNRSGCFRRGTRTGHCTDQLHHALPLYMPISCVSRSCKRCTSRLARCVRLNVCLIGLLSLACRRTVFANIRLCARSITAISCDCWTPSARFVPLLPTITRKVARLGD